MNAIKYSDLKNALLWSVTAALVIVMGCLFYQMERNEHLEAKNKKLRVENKAVKKINQEFYKRNLKLLQVIDSLKVANRKKTLWMTRALVSETSRTGKEMRVIATIIRNRVELGWRGHDTYKDVVLDPYQFSAFNPGRSTAVKYRQMTRETAPNKRIWDEARKIAREVLTAPRDDLPVSRKVTHFVHPESLRPPVPDWVYVLPKVKLEGISSQRLLAFRSTRYE